MLSLSTPFLLDTENENNYFSGIDWKDENSIIRQCDLNKFPLLRIKKKPIINIYESGGKVLCPATYGGLLSQYDNSFDHVAIYSRDDDEFIGEKIIRGVISANVLIDSFSRNCFQIITKNTSLLERSFISSKHIHTSGSFSYFLEQLEPTLVETGFSLI